MLTSGTPQPRAVASSGSACRNCLKAMGRPCRAGGHVKQTNGQLHGSAAPEPRCTTLVLQQKLRRLRHRSERAGVVDNPAIQMAVQAQLQEACLVCDLSKDEVHLGEQQALPHQAALLAQLGKLAGVQQGAHGSCKASKARGDARQSGVMLAGCGLGG